MKATKDFKCRITQRIFRKGQLYEGDREAELDELGYLEKDEDDDSDIWPKHRGAGVFELSDGTKVKGKEAAHEAQAAIDAEE